MYVQEVAPDDTLVRMCFHFSALIEDFAEIEVVEINPLMVFDSSRDALLSPGTYCLVKGKRLF